MATALAMIFSANAATLTIQTGGNDGPKILDGAQFFSSGSFVGNTRVYAKIDLGEVDFGSGSVYRAASIRFANGWQGGGTAVLTAGADFESAVPFARINNLLKYTYTSFRSFGANFTTSPTGKKHVYLSFENTAGNVLDVRFYNNTLSADMFDVVGDQTHESLLKEPCQLAGYAGKATVLDVNSSQLYYSSSADTKIDENNNSWGWTGEGVIVQYGNVDFGSGDTYKQVVLELKSHWGEYQEEHMVDVMIDNPYDEANVIASVWCGLNTPPYGCDYLARNLPAITGSHPIFLKWHGGSINIASVHFVKEAGLYSLGPIYYPLQVPINTDNETTEPGSGARHYSFRDEFSGNTSVYVGQNSGRTRILTNFSTERWESNNVGYTSDSVMLRITGVNFDGGFDEVVARYSTGGRWWDDATTFQFFLDDDINKIDLAAVMREAGIANPQSNSAISGYLNQSIDNLMGQVTIYEIFAAIEAAYGAQTRYNFANALFTRIHRLFPVCEAPVRSPGGVGWSDFRYNKGYIDTKRASGTHNVYVLYNMSGDDGANLTDFWFTTNTDVKPSQPVPSRTLSLRNLQTSGNATDEFKITDGDLTCIKTWKDGNDVILLCKDAKQYATPEAPGEGQIDYMARSEGGKAASEYDQSNWIMLRVKGNLSARTLKGYKLKNIQGKLTRGTDELTLSVVPLHEELDEFYVPNTYIACSFYGTQVSDPNRDGRTFFFVTPKPNEYMAVKWAIWRGNNYFDAPVSMGNGAGLQGGFYADFSLRTEPDPVVANLVVGEAGGGAGGGGYQMRAVMSPLSGGGNGAPRRAPGDVSTVRVVTLERDQQIITGITDLTHSSVTGDDHQAANGQPIYFDLTGRRVVNPAPGIYIVGGKKVLVK